MPNCTINEAPHFKEFVERSIGKENYECFLASTGYAISSLTAAKVAFFYVGPHDGGKSTAARLIASAFSPELVSNVSFSQLTDSHYTIMLLGKRLNASFDNSPKPMDHEDVFKSITSCEEIMGRELYENPVVFRPTVKLLYASNYPFSFKHPDEAIYRRMIILPFETSVPKKEQNPHLFEKLREERNIIFSLAAMSLKELVASNYDFIYVRSCVFQDVIEMHAYLSDPLKIKDESNIEGLGVLTENYLGEFYSVKAANQQLHTTMFRQITISISPAGNTCTDKEYMKIGKEIAEYYFNKGYQIIWYLHKDTTRPHLHLLLNSVNFKTGKIFKQSKKDMNVSATGGSKIVHSGFSCSRWCSFPNCHRCRQKRLTNR